jgi:hypothetical protein
MGAAMDDEMDQHSCPPDSQKTYFIMMRVKGFADLMAGNPGQLNRFIASLSMQRTETRSRDRDDCPPENIGPWRTPQDAKTRAGGNIMQFKDLTVGQHFRFERELSGSLVGIRFGESVKTGRMKYRYVMDGQEHRVGSVTVEVVPVASGFTLIFN